MRSAPEPARLSKKPLFFCGPVLTALQACRMSVKPSSCLSDPQHFRFASLARAGSGTVICHPPVRHACASAVFMDHRALWVRQLFGFGSPKTRADWYDRWCVQHAGCGTDQERAVLAARPTCPGLYGEGKRCRGMRYKDHNNHGHHACLAPRSAELPKNIFFCGPVSHCAAGMQLVRGSLLLPVQSSALPLALLARAGSDTVASLSFSPHACAASVLTNRRRFWYVNTYGI